MGERIAVVGGGIAGLTAAYLLSRCHDVELFEKEQRLGGNAYTYATNEGEVVDIAVAAFGQAGYPLFYRLLDELGVQTSRSPSAYMSFHDLDTHRGLYITPSPGGLIRQGFQLFQPDQAAAVWRLLKGVRHLRSMLHAGRLADLTIAEALEEIPALHGMARVMFLCTLCLLSSQSSEEVLSAPATFFAHKLDVHHDVISPKAVWSVRTVQGWTRAYVQALAKPLKDRVRSGAAVHRVRRHADRVDLVLDDGTTRSFQRVVFACHADQALMLIDHPTAAEQHLLGAWRYKSGRVVVHRDHSSFPSRSLQQAYTFLYTQRNGRIDTSVNGTLRFEPGVDKRCDLISSQHPNFDIQEDKIVLDTWLRTPVFDADSCATIEDLPCLNGQQRSYFCGAHMGHGLHEDAVRSAAQVAAMLGVEFLR